MGGNQDQNQPGYQDPTRAVTRTRTRATRAADDPNQDQYG